MLLFIFYMQTRALAAKFILFYPSNKAVVSCQATTNERLNCLQMRDNCRQLLNKYILAVTAVC